MYTVYIPFPTNNRRIYFIQCWEYASIVGLAHSYIAILWLFLNCVQMAPCRPASSWDDFCARHGPVLISLRYQYFETCHCFLLFFFVFAVMLWRCFLGPCSWFQFPVQEPFFLFGSQRRRSLSLLVLTLIFPALLPCLVRDSLCTALQTKILWINGSLNAIDTMETWVSGNLTALTERSQPAIRWRVGEVVNRVSCGSFRGGHWYLPIRNHDNRSSADWIRLYPGLSKNSENGNSCPKPYKAARMIEAVGRAVSIETETIIAIWILPRRSSRLYKGKLIKMRPKWTKTDRE